MKIMTMMMMMMMMAKMTMTRPVASLDRALTLAVSWFAIDHLDSMFVLIHGKYLVGNNCWKGVEVE